MSAGSILVVCTGNVCRSPYVEFRLRRALAETHLQISSAGTQALVGQPVDPGSVALLEAQEIDCADFAARDLTAEMVCAADLVLTATREHRAKVARTEPSGLKKAMALVDFSDLVHELDLTDLKPSFMDPPGMSGVALLVSAAARRREQVTPRRDEEANIVDPFKQGPKAFQRMEREIDAALPPVIHALGSAV